MEAYKEYMGQPDALGFEEAMEIYEKITAQLNMENEDDREMWADYRQAAGNYAAIRAKWPLLSMEDKMETDAARTAAHNRSITALNLLARWYLRTGRDSAWRTQLGDVSWQKPGYDVANEIHRKKIGDFNCYVALVLGLGAR